jgi:phenylalanyl-tRNA synthetase beta chain
MRISVNWLKEYVSFNVPLSSLIETLERIGLMVDSVEKSADDTILDIETYANRPDTLGHKGMAREVAVALGMKIKDKKQPLVEIEEKTEDLIGIQISNEKLCPRYAGIVIKDIKVGPSPKWLRTRIESMGLNPVNNVVDASNYVLFATSHPIHAFDMAKLKGKRIIIRNAKKGEQIKTLEGIIVPLAPDMLVISDEEHPVAIAGVIGGEESGVTEETQDVFIESAYFDPVSVRKTAKKIGLQTDASYRFERGADISFPPHAALMAASILSQFEGKVTKGVVDVYPAPRKPKTLTLRNHRITELLGIEVDSGFIEKILSALGFGIEKQQNELWQVKIPSFRVDIDREVDLVEEIARYHGYEKIPSRIPVLKDLEPAPNPVRARINSVRQILFHHGLDEVVNFSFMDSEKVALFGDERNPVQIRNPVSSKSTLMRTNLLDGLLENVAWNKNRDAEGIHIFEIGNVYSWHGEECVERPFLSMASMGIVGSVNWQENRKKTDFYYLKGICESLFSQTGEKSISFEEKDIHYFQNGLSLALLLKGQAVGYLGALRHEILDFYSIKDPVWAAELDLSFLSGKQDQEFHYSPVGKYPSMIRDISFITDDDVVYQVIKRVVEKISIPYLESFYLLDRFSGKPIPQDKISLSFRFVFRHPKRTLRTEEVDNFQQMIIETLKTNFNFQLREGEKIDK